MTPAQSAALERLSLVKHTCQLTGLSVCPACSVSVLAQTVRALQAEKEEAEKSLQFSREWWSSRWDRLQEWARKDLPEPFVNQFFNITANGTRDVMEQHRPCLEAQVYYLTAESKERGEMVRGLVGIIKSECPNCFDAELYRDVDRCDGGHGHWYKKEATPTGLVSGAYFGPCGLSNELLEALARIPEELRRNP